MMTATSNMIILACLLLVCNTVGLAAKLLGEVRRIEALLGGKATMPCDVTTSSSNDSLLLLVWYKANKPFYSFDGRLLKHWRSGEFFQNDRILFTFHTEPASLLMDRVNLNDEGIYRCRADFALSPTRNSGIELFVIIVPSKPFFMDEIGMKVENTVGPFHEGDTLLLICLAVGGKPIPKLTWWKSNTLLDSTDEPSEVPGVRENQLMLTLTREYAGAKIQCLASNNNITVPLSSSVDIELYVSPDTVTILSSNQALSAGKLYELPCYVNGSYPIPNVSWWLNGKIITDQQIVTETTRSEVISNLHFKPRIEHNGMDLTCLATNAVMAPNHGSKMHTLRLNIFFPPMLSLTFVTDKNEKYSIEEGKIIQLRCMVEANPWITNTEWFANNKTIQGGSFNGSPITLTSNDLLILNASTRHTGTYTCMAFNLEGSGMSNKLEIQILYRPKCVKSNYTQYDNVTKLRCPVIAFPQAAKFYWQIKNYSKLTDSDTIIDRNSDTLDVEFLENLLKNKYLDEFNISCWAINDVGEQNVPCKMIFKRTSTVPDPPNDCTLDANENMIIVKCAPADTNGGLDRLFGVSVWQITNNSRTLINNITSPLSKVQVDNLKKGQMYEVLLYTFNKWGESTTVKLLGETIDNSQMIDGAGFDIGMWSGIIVGLIATFGILILICIFKKRSKSVTKNEKDEASINKRNEKQTQNVSVSADITEKPLLYKNALTTTSMNNSEPKNSENINLVQLAGDDFTEPPPISRLNKPKFPSSDCFAPNCDIILPKLKTDFRNTKYIKEVIKLNEALEANDDNHGSDNEISNLKLFNMSRESIV